VPFNVCALSLPVGRKTICAAPVILNATLNLDSKVTISSAEASLSIVVRKPE